MLGARPGDAHDVHFLKRIVADQRRRHLPRKHHYGNGIHIRRSDSRNRIGGPGSRGHQTDPHLARGPGITVRRMGRALLVPHQKMLQKWGAGQFIVNIQHHAAGKSENMLDAFAFQTFQKNLTAGQFHADFSFARYWAKICSILSRPANFNF